MEGSPFKKEDETEQPDSSSKKKKSPDSLGAFAFEAKKEPAEDTEESRNFLEKLFRGDETAETDRPETETELSLEEISPEETQVVTEQLVAAQPELIADTTDIETEDEVEAVETFRDKIVVEHKDANTALAETLAEFEIDETPTPEKPQIPRVEHQPIEATVERPDDNSNQTPPPKRPPAWVMPGAMAGLAGAAAARPEYISVSNESDAVGMALLGGIVGYLIGRRRGRLKAEKRLRPIQKKLEKRVTGLQQDLITKETRLRQVVRSQARQTEKINRLNRAERRQRQRTTKIERHIRRAVAPEAHRLHGGAASVEKLGKVIIGAEALTTVRDRVPLTKHRIENLTHAELLAASEKIPVEHSTLRQIYETRLISEQGLRRLVETQAAGGDLKQALRQEIMEHDIDFERDPGLRDHRPRQTAGATASVAAIQTILARATDDSVERDREAVLQARIAHETREQLKQQRQRQLMDIGLIGTIMALTAAVMILLLTR